MTFNVWYGGVQVDFPSIGRAISAADADIVGVQEPEGAAAPDRPLRGTAVRRRDAARDLALPAVRSERRRRAHRLRGRPTWITWWRSRTCTSPPRPYGPEWVRDGRSARGRAQARARDAPARDQALPAAAGGLARRGVPVFLTGDMNSPSYLDWTRGSRGAAAGPLSAGWPSRRRWPTPVCATPTATAYPDPVARPGSDLDRPARRRRGSSRARRSTGSTGSWRAGRRRRSPSRLVGEAGGPDVDVGLDPWGSDHRAVASTFDADPRPRATPGQRVAARGAPRPDAHDPLHDHGRARAAHRRPAGPRQPPDRDAPDPRRQRPPGGLLRHAPARRGLLPGRAAGPATGRSRRARRSGCCRGAPDRASRRRGAASRRASRSGCAGATRPATSSTGSGSTAPARSTSTTTSGSATSARCRTAA